MSSLANNKILICTHNLNKVIEFKILFQETNIQILSLNDLNIDREIEETGDTFKENAYIKASFFHKLTGYPCISDDSGLSIRALNFKPGVHSKRFTPSALDSSNNKKVLELLENERDRYAFYTCALCFIIDDKIISIEEICEGTIALSEKIGNGFGYDSIFIPLNQNLRFSELSDEIKNNISHRAKAFKKLIDEIGKL
ncbi:MAG: RdgB/HAM1 family non-canonical purine NTP pyrophosphatase [Acholeplasmatales bacterium]|jgi:XTP/dITP diphosphohydrolase|nr:RdgB/HAM1 family non-canonical purine NTP pyrophosphatase [Acholeplasmatales bacterium]